MYTISPTETQQESTHVQAFVPIVATLLFAFASAPMMLGWQPNETVTRGITRNTQPGQTILLAQCVLPEHLQSAQECPCGRN
jgi:hypothetical protein